MSAIDPSIANSNNIPSSFFNYRNATKVIMITSLVTAIAATILLTPVASIVPFAISATTVEIKAVAAITAAIFLIAAAILYKTREKTLEEANDSNTGSSSTSNEVEAEEKEEEEIDNSNPPSRSSTPPPVLSPPSSPSLKPKIPAGKIGSAVKQWNGRISNDANNSKNADPIAQAIARWNTAKDNLKKVEESSNSTIKKLKVDITQEKRPVVQERINQKIEAEKQKVIDAEQEITNSFEAMKALQAQKKDSQSPQKSKSVK